MPWQNKNHITFTGNNILMKVIYIIVIITFTLNSNLSYAFQNPAFFGTKSHLERNVRSRTEENLIDIRNNPAAITIPSEYGQIVESYKGKGIPKDTPFVVHIQDCHVNEVAQLNIARMLKFLAENYDIRLLCLEGASKRLDTSFYNSFPDGQIKEKVSRFFIKKALFTGAEYFKITNRDLDISAFGVEDRNLYLDHLKGYQQVQPDKEEIISYLSRLEADLNKIKAHLYSRSLRELEDKNRKYQQGIITLAEYGLYLNQSAKRQKVDWGDYSNFRNLIRLTKKEKEIDFAKAEEQRHRLIEELSQRLDEKELKKLLKLSLDFRLSKISVICFYDYLQDFIKTADYRLKPQQYKELLSYTEYLRLSSQINHLILFDEIESLYEKIADKLFESKVQKKAFRFSRSLAFLKDFYDLKLTHKALDYINENPNQFDIRQIASFIRDTSNRLALGIYFDEGLLDINAQQLKAARRFYQIATKRDIAIVDNTLKRLPYSSNQAAVLITGGFHTSGITNILKQKKISYLVICPNIREADHQRLYADRMKGIFPDYADILQVIYQNIVPALATGDIADILKIRGFTEQAFALAFAGEKEYQQSKTFFDLTNQNIIKRFILSKIKEDRPLTLEYAAEIIRAAINAAGVRKVGLGQGLVTAEIKTASAGRVDVEKEKLSIGKVLKTTLITAGTGGLLYTGAAFVDWALKPQPVVASMVTQAQLAPQALMSAQIPLAPQPNVAAQASVAPQTQPADITPKKVSSLPARLPPTPTAPAPTITDVLIPEGLTVPYQEPTLPDHELTIPPQGLTLPHPTIIIAEEGLKLEEQLRNYKDEYQRIQRTIELVYANKISEEEKIYWRLLLLGTVSTECNFLDKYSGVTPNGSSPYGLIGQTLYGIIHNYVTYPIKVAGRDGRVVYQIGKREELIPLFAKATYGRVTWQELEKINHSQLKELLAEYGGIEEITQGKITWEMVEKMDHFKLKRLLAEGGDIARATKGKVTWKEVTGKSRFRLRRLSAEDRDFACLMSLFAYKEEFERNNIVALLPADHQDLSRFMGKKWTDHYNKSVGTVERFNERFGDIHKPLHQALAILYQWARAELISNSSLRSYLYQLLSNQTTTLLKDEYGITPSNLHSKVTAPQRLKEVPGARYVTFNQDEKVHFVILPTKNRIRTSLVVCEDISKWAEGKERAVEIDIVGGLNNELAKHPVVSMPLLAATRAVITKPSSAGNIVQLEDHCLEGIRALFKDERMRLDAAFKLNNVPFGLIVSANCLRIEDISTLNMLMDSKGLQGEDKFAILIDVDEEQLGALRATGLSKGIGSVDEFLSGIRGTPRAKGGKLLYAANMLSKQTICTGMIIDEDTARGYKERPERLPEKVFVRAQQAEDVTVDGILREKMVSFKAMLLDLLNVFHDFNRQHQYSAEDIIKILEPISSVEFAEFVEGLRTTYQQILQAA